ncbi:DMT family transporter [Acuticoccus kandeliae]|uniref:DMT family transporter n=1 Tax=Acuticoccus kandeliae TaxID=2073160 RepID=UPI001300611B|nr:DMT family transporter [Acuticoccus kandeliae]
MSPSKVGRSGSLVLVLIAGLFWSLGGVLVRLIEGASGWQIIFYRSLTQTVVLLIAMQMLGGGGSLASRIVGIGRYGSAASLFLAAAFIAFVFSIINTNVANTLLILAAVPFIAAFLAFLVLRESPSRATFLGAIAAACGIAIMVGADFSGPFLRGNLIAIVGACCFASYIVCMRGGRSGDMLPANAVAGILSAIVAGFMLDDFAISAHDLAMCIALGIFQTGLGLVAFTLGSKELKASELALLSLIHVILGPIWVLLLVGEVPTIHVLIGGGVVLSAIVVPAVLDLRRVRA